VNPQVIRREEKGVEHTGERDSLFVHVHCTVNTVIRR
jgi:hypothetical protein